MASDWWLIPKDDIAFPPGRSGRGNQGPRPLTTICARIVADNIHRFSEPEDLGDVPKHLFDRLLKELRPRMSFHAWKILVTLGHDSELGDESYVDEIDPDNFGAADLTLYTKPLTSPDLNFVTILTIQSISRFPQAAQQLLSLAKLPNLYGLTLDDGPTDPTSPPATVSDRLVRGWSEVCEKPFPVLSWLKLIAQPDQITLQAVRYASAFPCLQYLVIPAGLSSLGQGDKNLVKSWGGWDTKGCAYKMPNFMSLPDGRLRPRAVICLSGHFSGHTRFNAKMQRFFRRPWEVKEKNERGEEKLSKRKRGEDGDGDGDETKNSNAIARKRGVKSSKQQSIGNMLSEFGTF
ncbi:hypothetical protein QBC43DRAFT_325893 [Cladorrhinum sp. PSN259]|nr:hypothetical protein QBC43DRAFT_325893 [Cladorrhinum sp. PSN259]